MNYLQFFSDKVKYLEPFDDAERGRLLTAMLSYAFDDVEPVLTGNERFIWPVFKDMIDQSRSSLDKKRRAGSAKIMDESEKSKSVKTEEDSEQSESEENTLSVDNATEQDPAQTNTENQNGAEASTSEQEAAEPSEDQHNEAKGPINHESRINNNDYDKRARAGAEGLASEEDVRRYRENMGAIEDAAKGIGLPFASNDFQMAENLMSEYGAEWVLEAIRRTQYRNRTWGIVTGILKSWKKKGGIDDAGSNAASSAGRSGKPMQANGGGGGGERKFDMSSKYV